MEGDGFSEKGDRSQPGHPEVHDNGSTSEERIRSEKEARILDACQRRDIEDLEALAQSPGGFLTDELRRQAWPVLLGLPLRIRAKSNDDKGAAADDEETEDDSWRSLPPHRDEEQVKLDVARSFVYYPDRQSEHELELKRTALSNLILSVLRRYPYLHYFQGYHDIAQVFLLVLPPPLLQPAVARLSLLRIRDFMLPTLAAAVAQLRLLPALLRAADPRLWRHLGQTEPFFALSGTLTMYAHDVQSLGEITRLFDVLLAREPVFSVYLFAAIVRGRRDELFDHPASEPEVLHSVLSKLPRPLDLDALVARAADLLAAYPPETALGPAWHRGVSPHSVLKTARAARACAGQSEAVGAYYFAQHARDVARRERRDKILRVLREYRRPARTVGLALLVGVLAYWMRKSVITGPSSLWNSSSGGGFLAPVAALLSKWWPLEF